MKSAVIEEQTECHGSTERDAVFAWDGGFWDKRQLGKASKMKQHLSLRLEQSRGFYRS